MISTGGNRAALTSMRNSFPAFQPRTQDDFERLWLICVFAFDASALLDLYQSIAATNCGPQAIDLVNRHMFSVDLTGWWSLASRSIAL
jgi:hypothetical protein